jgi:chromosome partitioning protein
MKGQIITVVSDKGGVGKTTGATSIAHGLAQREAGVLLVDFDLLGQDAIVLGLPPEPGVYNHFVRQIPAGQTVRATGRPGLSVLPGDSWTRRADHELRGRSLEEALDCLWALAASYDYTVIDTHPSGHLQELAIRVADVVVSPVRPEALALDGVAATLAAVRELGQPQQIILLPTMYDERLTAHRYHYGLLQTTYGGLVAQPVPNRVAVAEAHLAGQTVWEYGDRRGELAKVRAAYAALLDWLVTEPTAVLFGEGVR